MWRGCSPPLDQMSGGRVGWNVVTSSAASEAFNFSHDKHAAHADRYRARRRVHPGRAQGLWDTWEDDAFVMDKAKGLFFHPDKLPHASSQGRAFLGARAADGSALAAGPAGDRAGRPIRRRPRACGADRGGFVTVAAAARARESVLYRPQGPRRQVRALAGFAQDHARCPNRGGTDRGGDAGKIREAAGTNPSRAGRGRAVGHRLRSTCRSFPLDGPLPEVPLSNSQQGRQQMVVGEMARSRISPSGSSTNAWRPRAAIAWR